MSATGIGETQATADGLAAAGAGGATVRPRRNLWRIYALETWYEWLKQLRLPGFVLPLLAFPLGFYMLFGVVMKQPGGYDVSRYLLATYGAAGAITASLFGFGVGLATERGQGWLLLKRATPMPPLAYLTAKLVVGMALSATVVAALFTLGATLGGVRMPALTWVELGGVLIVGGVPFAALGLAIGCWARPNSAPSIVNLLSLGMAFASGLWIPIEVMPRTMRQLAPWLPAYHLGQLALRVVGAGRGTPAPVSLLVLAGVTVACLALARVGFRRDEGRTYG